MRFGIFIGAGLVIAVALAVFVSPQASSKPDGLEKVAAQKQIDGRARDNSLAGGPTAGYAVKGVDDEAVSTGLAGLIGVTVVFVAAGALFLVLRRAGGRGASGAPAAPTGDHAGG